MTDRLTVAVPSKGRLAEPSLDPRAARGTGRARQARARLRLGRGLAATGALGRDRRPRLDRLDGERERPAPRREAARLPGGARREPGSAPARRTARADAVGGR